MITKPSGQGAGWLESIRSWAIRSYLPG